MLVSKEIPGEATMVLEFNHESSMLGDNTSEADMFVCLSIPLAHCRDCQRMQSVAWLADVHRLRIFL